jgi:hypothetical protein
VSWRASTASWLRPLPLFQLGSSTEWSIAAEPGEYCFTLWKGNPELQVWFTLVLQRP